MKLVLVGGNYKTTPLEWREALTLTRTEREEAIRYFQRAETVREVLLLQTCNRVEFYFWLDGDGIPEQVRCWFAGRLGEDWDRLRESLYIYWDLAAVHHLYCVAAGLDSMVLGEEQILGQVREAYGSGVEWGGVGTYFHQLMSEALRVGKRIRTETGLSRSGISISTAAVEWVREFHPKFPALRAAVLGAGEMGRLALASLYAAGVRDLVVLNRSEAKGRELAGAFGGRVVSWTEKRTVLASADLVISSTSAPHYVITAGDLAERKEGKPLLIIDLAVPRDVEPEAGIRPGVRVCHIDDLQELAIRLSPHRELVVHAHSLVEREVKEFANWLRVREVIPVIRAIRDRGELIRRQELEKAGAGLRELGERERQLLQEVTYRIVARLLHEPTVRLKEWAERGEEGEYVQWICKLYDLPESGEGG